MAFRTNKLQTPVWRRESTSPTIFKSFTTIKNGILKILKIIPSLGMHLLDAAMFKDEEKMYTSLTNRHLQERFVAKVQRSRPRFADLGPTEALFEIPLRYYPIMQLISHCSYSRLFIVRKVDMSVNCALHSGMNIWFDTSILFIYLFRDFQQFCWNVRKCEFETGIPMIWFPYFLHANELSEGNRKDAIQTDGGKNWVILKIKQDGKSHGN